MKFIITIDTEADNQWQENSTSEVKNLEYIPRFQEFAEKFNMNPVYLCTTEVLESDLFPQIFKPYINSGNAEVGAHLHPWTSPPFDDNYNTDKIYPSELPLELFERKMAGLTELLEKKTGKKPVSYRAGRWGFSYEHAPVLSKLGYKVDCSLTPFLSWDKYIGQNSGGPKASIKSAKPFFFKNSNDLLEVPPTVLLNNFLISKEGYLQELFIRTRNKLLTRFIAKLFNLGPHWLRPYPNYSADNLIYFCKVAKNQKLPILEIMFHSSELMPGGSPYNPDKKSIELLYKKFEKLFSFLADNNIPGITLEQYYNEFKALK